MSVEFQGPAVDRAIVLVAASGDTVRAPLPSPAAMSQHVADTLQTVPAYRFTVLAVAGGGEAFRSTKSLLAIPWKYDSSCALLPWERDDWVATGEEAVFVLTARRTEFGSEPLYDVLGWHSPYPQGEFLKYETDTASATAPDSWLSAREYFDMVRALPDLPEETPAERLVRIEQVLAAGDVRWRSAFPGTEILRRARAAAAR